MRPGDDAAVPCHLRPEILPLAYGCAGVAAAGCAVLEEGLTLPESRRALLTTDTELRLIAKAAIIGLNSSPKEGYSTPAAIGTPRAL